MEEGVESTNTGDDLWICVSNPVYLLRGTEYVLSPSLDLHPCHMAVTPNNTDLQGCCEY